MTKLPYRHLYVSILFLLLRPIYGFVCTGNRDIDILNDGETEYDCGTFTGPVHLVWKVTGNTGFFYNDEYSVRLKRDGVTIYESNEFSDSNEEGKSGLISGDNGGLYEVTIRCRNEVHDCTYGRFQYKVVACGCDDPGGNDLVVVSPCKANSYNIAQDTICGGNCDPGYYSDPDNGCTECPNFQIITTSNIKTSYENLVGFEQCGVQGTTGFWSLAHQGSVGADGTVVTWSLTRSQSVSDGVERSNEFARAYGQVRGSSTSFETSVSVGFTASVSGGLFGMGVGAETSIDTTTTIGQTKSFEVSTESTNAISNAVSSVITNDESITCEQSCGPNPDDPADVQVSIFNWVDAVYEEQTGEILHYVRTCSTVCKYDNVPPICPPGKCFNRDCNICTPNAFLSAEVDGLASQVPPTAAPTRPPVAIVPTISAASYPNSASRSQAVFLFGIATAVAIVFQ